MPETAVRAGAATEQVVVGFVRALRAEGIVVPVGATVAFATALDALDPTARAEVYWAGRATLVCRPEDHAVYDRVFARVFDGTDVLVLTAPDLQTIRLALDDGTDDEAPPDAGDDLDEAATTIAVRWSAAEVLRTRDFAAYSPEEFAEAKRLMADLRLAGALRRSRRHRRARRGHPDVRRTVRRALRSGGEPVRRAYRGPSTRPRRIVLLCDVSGSMEPYARALVRFLHAAVVGRNRVEAFAFGTRLTRVTRELSSRDPDVAVAAAARRVVDWSGGTRIGEGLREFNDRWGVRGMARGAVVVILSDGWDRGDPEMLAEQMARLGRVAYRIVWVNPLKATPEYAPLARGMAAALPYVDEFVEGHSLAALEDLVAVIAR
ncbi:MAG: vWA domain-containing protein [Actinomycetota bacterium]